MDFGEAIDLLRTLSNVRLKSARANSWVRPRIVSDAKKQGYFLVFKEDSLESAYRRFLEEIVANHQYTIKKHDGYLFIYSS